MGSYISGSLVRETGTFTDITGALNDPTVVTLMYQIGSASIVTLVYGASSIVRVSIGVYYYQFDTTGFSGSGSQSYVCQWMGTGTVQAINNDSFTVTAPLLA
jgi:hypothetical protein